MTQIHLDFSGVEDFEPLPNGDYPVLVDSVELRESTSNPGDFYLNWALIVTDESEYEGRRLWMSNGLTEKSLYYLRQQFLNLGVIDEEDVELDLEIDEDTNFLISPEVAGIAAIASVSARVRNKKVVNEVTSLYLEDLEPVFTPAEKPAPKAAPKTVSKAAPVATKETPAPAGKAPAAKKGPAKPKFR